MIEVKSLVKDFANFHAVRDVSFDIPTGEIVGLLGPNGAGKTTTMRMITGFLRPTSGVVLIDGVDVNGGDEEGVACRRKIGYMSESVPLYADMIVYDYLSYVADMCGISDKEERINALCVKCALKEVMSNPIGELSRGYKQRVGLAHALINDPEILILDEPTSGLDPNQVEDVRALIKEAGKKKTVIISTHILSEVEMLCGRVIIINEGCLVADSPTTVLRERYGGGKKREFRVTAADGADAEDLERRLKATVGVADVVMEKNSLEDVFHELTK